MRGPSRGNTGFAVTEAVVAGTLLLLIIQVSWWVTAVQSAAATRIVGEARILDENRLIHHLLVTEVGHGLAQTDWSVGAGVLALRAFRGVGFACRTQPDDGWGVATSGYRSPDPDKDSVLVFSEESGWQVSRLAGRAAAGSLDCQDVPGFSTAVWSLDPPRPGALAGVYFERGQYRFSSGAFRYRVGSGGWQPLTSTGIADDSTTLDPAGANGVAARVLWTDIGAPSGSVAWHAWGVR